MSMKPSKREQAAARETRIKQAVCGILKGHHKSIYRAAKVYNLPRSTIYDRLHQKPTRVEAR